MSSSDEELEWVQELEINSEENDEIDIQHRKIIHVFLLFLFLWQSLFRISDNAVSLVLSFMAKFFLLIGTCLQLNSLNDLGRIFPNTLYRAKKILGRIQERFKKYVSCPACHKLYLFDNCTVNNGKESLKCSFKQYPRHVQARMRVPCGHMLLKTMHSSSGTDYLAPYQTYCYMSVISSLEELLNRPNYVHICESWKKKIRRPGILSDVYDGGMWQHFQYDQNGQPFLAATYNYLLMLNCDWFQPYKHTSFSVGVLRFKRENIILVGIIPGPSEPSMNINTYLNPLIDDLKQLWLGVNIRINGQSKTIRAALSCLTCDVPAARKVGGFVGHRGKRGCSRCFKLFPTQTFGDNPDYSGFDKSDWEPRSHALHVWYAQKQEAAKTETERKAVEAMYGARYTSLYQLPYYNAISSCIIDPMHCLFLGIAKHFFKVWVSNNILSEKEFHTIQNRVDSFKTPPDIGRIPYKINSKFSGLKADQWKNWTLYFSLYSLKGILPPRDYDCWLMFVKVCTKICRRSVNLKDLDSIDEGIQDFCTLFEGLYGKHSLTPNMHLAGHITDCIRDHGPVFAFWLYAFERMNGVLGSFHTSNHNVTVQLMRKFLSMQMVSLDQWPKEFKDKIGPLFQPYIKEIGSLSETLCPTISQSIKPLPPITERAFTPEEMSEVVSTVNSFHIDCNLQVLTLYKRTSSLVIGNSTKFASERSRYKNCSKIFVGDTLYEIDSFIQVTVMVTSDSDSIATEKQWLVRCFMYSDHQCKPWFGYPTQVWSATLNRGFHYFLLTQIDGRAVVVESKVNFGSIIGEDNVIAAVPVPFSFDIIPQNE